MKQRISKTIGALTVALATITLMNGEAHAGDTAHLDRGLTLVEHLLEHQWAGQFEDGDGVALNAYGGSWGGGTLIVEPGDPDDGILPYNLSKCGSFVTKLLNHSYNWNWSDYEFYDPSLGTSVTTASPTAHRYMELILQGEGFQSMLTHIVDVAPGDIVVKRDVGTTTGHVWIVKEVILSQPMPYPSDSSNALNSLVGTTYFEIDVLDCSSGYHSNDTRKVYYDGQLHETHGAGVGTIGVLVDENGQLVGHSWSLPSSGYGDDIDSWVSQLNSKIELFDETELVVGRLATENNSQDSPAPEPEENAEPEESPEPQVSESEAPLHLDLGRLLLNQILSAQAQGIYTDQEGVDLNRKGGSWGSQSNPAFIRFADPEQGILPKNNTKGTTLVSLLLAAAYGHSWSDFEFYDTKKDQIEDTASPSSTRYVDLIEQHVGFTSQIVHLADVLPGDVLAIRYLSNWSGHTMMVNGIDWAEAIEYPTESSAAEAQWQGCWLVPVEVLDSTGSPHSFDTREVGDEEYEGIGIGTVGLFMNADYEVVGHTWSLPSADPISKPDQWVSQLHSRLKPQSERKLVIGRF